MTVCNKEGDALIIGFVFTVSTEDEENPTFSSVMPVMNLISGNEYNNLAFIQSDETKKIDTMVDV